MAYVELLWCLSLPWVTLYHIPLTKSSWPSIRNHREVCGNCLLWGSSCQCVSSPCVGLQYSSSWSTLGCCLQISSRRVEMDIKFKKVSLQPIKHIISVHQQNWQQQPSESHGLSFPHAKYYAHFFLANSHWNHTRKRLPGDVFSRLNKVVI